MKLIQHVLHIRGLIAQALTNKFDRMGLRADESLPKESLGEAQRATRDRLDFIMSSNLGELGNYAEARTATINECVFTLFNRIAAIKVMEDRELFPEVIRRRTEHANRSFAHNAWLEENPEERGAEREGLKHFIQYQFKELSDRIPLFDANYPYSLMPTADELFFIIDAFNAVAEDADCGEDIWKDDDILGWLYENFNATEKVALKDSGDKTEYNKVSLQSQVYTPKWVVKFLVDNSLGKLYLEMFPDSKIVELKDETTNEQKYKIANAPSPSEFPKRKRKDMKELRLIDPACGSGNFLLYACEVFYDLYQNQVEQYGADYSRREIPKLIVENNLYGVDLDERAVQITQIALFIKAWQLGGRRSTAPKQMHVVSTHFMLPAYEDVEMAFTMGSNWRADEKEVIQSVWTDLRDAYKFGSLIRVEEKFDALLPASSDDMFANEWKSGMFDFKQNMMTQLHNQVHQWSGNGSNAFTLGKVNDAITFLEILSAGFDVAVANPPYTDSADFGAELKEFVEANYRKPLKFNTNLYAAFIKRCCELTNEDGKIGIVHPLTFMYIKTFEDVRKFLIEKTHISLFVEWGYLGMFNPSARVDSAMYIAEKGSNELDSTFIKLGDYYEGKRYDYYVKAYDDLCNGIANSDVYTLPQSKLKGIKSYPFIYWISDEFRQKFGGDDLDSAFDIRAGIQTSNNNRFLRFWWENLESNISLRKEQAGRWVLYSKGGPFCKWFGNMWLTIDWKDKGLFLQEYLKSRKQDLHAQEYYYKSGITYSASGSKGMSFRYYPSDCLFDIGGSCLFDCGEFHNMQFLLGVMNSRLSTYLTNCFNPTVNKQPNDIKRIPFVVPSKELEEQISTLSQQCVSIKKHLCTYSIIEQNYAQSPITLASDIKNEIQQYYNYENALLTQILINEAIINKAVFEVYELNDHDRQMVLEKEGIPVGDMPVTAEAKTAFLAWIEGDTEFAASTELIDYIKNLPTEDIEKEPFISGFDTLYQNNNGLEEFCNKQKVNPINVWYWFREAGILPAQRSQSLVFELLTDVIRTVLANDDDGVIPIIERAGEEQLGLRIEEELINRGFSTAHISQLFAMLGAPLPKYLQEQYFEQLSNHLNLFMYLPKTPFIWHITSGEHHALELYVSIYRWNRDTLYRLKSVYSGNRESALSDRLEVLSAKDDAASKIEAEKVKEQLAELKAFNAKVDDLLASGYDPKLNDGVGKNIAPLQKRKMIAYEVLNAGQMKKYLNADW